MLQDVLSLIPAEGVFRRESDYALPIFLNLYGIFPWIEFLGVAVGLGKGQVHTVPFIVIMNVL